MDWMPVIGLLALICLLLGTVVLVVRLRKLHPLEELPEGDYEVTLLEVQATPHGQTTVYRIDKPEALQGRKVVLLNSSEVTKGSEEQSSG
ncbi:hypothetical protein LCGC14_2699600 [marine sediment metagenome]|uniref:Uncharacterized protein n=1 Tax=marine sediment metagenome TaxID=412755 RepID=A0A0F8ZG74_9ZZZZ